MAMLPLVGCDSISTISPTATTALPVSVKWNGTAEYKDSYEIKLKSRQFTPQSGIEIDQYPIKERRSHVILQFYGIPNQKEREMLGSVGVNLLAYIPNKAWFASIPTNFDLDAQELSNLRWIGKIDVKDKLDPSIRAEYFRSEAINTNGTINLQIIFFRDVSDEIAELVLSKYKTEIKSGPGMLNDWTVKLDKSAIYSLATEDAVQYIAQPSPANIPTGDRVRAKVGVNIVQVTPYNLNGEGVKIGIWDFGPIDTLHNDFAGRLTLVETDPGYGSEHPTFVAGIMAGDGTRSQIEGGTPLQWRGMAPAAQIYSYNAYDEDEPEEHDSAINVYGIDLSQNSWEDGVDSPNCDEFGDYTDRSAKFDNVVYGVYGKKIPIIFNAGNSRLYSDCGMDYGTINPPGGTAKNVITVGGVNVKLRT